ncbi:MAG: hypothetical protein HFH35_10270 [Eubacterium sp.]|nr:hypothetical protein [Eubacterium sp.]
MIYIFTALYHEAQCIIKFFDLKKTAESQRFMQFENETAQIRLTVSGVGEIAAAAAVSSTCTQNPPRRTDFLCNIGICAGAGELEGIYMIHKITEQASQKTWYPDILYRHPFPEAEIITAMKPWEGDTLGAGVPASADAADSGTLLYDMEAAAVYQAGAYFFGPHQMQFLKIVSDHGTGLLSRKEQPNAGKAAQLMEQYKEPVTAWISRLGQAARRDGRLREQEANERLEQLVRRLCTDLHASHAMEMTVRKQMRYLELAGADYTGMLRKWYQKNKLPCRNRKEGKQILAQWCVWE